MKVYYDKDTIHKCRECDVNFKVEDKGWFVEMHEFNVDLKTKIVRNAKRLIKGVIPKSVLEIIREGKR